jgi:serine/threonine protein kinase
VFLSQGDSREAVAVKVVSKKTLNKTSMENLLTEIEILKTVRHPHIVQLKDFQVHVAGHVWFARQSTTINLTTVSDWHLVR